ncbi:MAG: hypothetical protein QOG21_173 [Actinomycetota bacterium]|nr:hypothetical protein [Actinomycetota bacterium]
MAVRQPCDCRHDMPVRSANAHRHTIFPLVVSLAVLTVSCHPSPSGTSSKASSRLEAYAISRTNTPPGQRRLRRSHSEDRTLTSLDGGGETPEGITVCPFASPRCRRDLVRLSAPGRTPQQSS